MVRSHWFTWKLVKLPSIFDISFENFLQKFKNRNEGISIFVI